MGKVVVACGVADPGDRQPGRAHQQSAGEIDAYPIDFQDERHAGRGGSCARMRCGFAQQWRTVCKDSREPEP